MEIFENHAGVYTHLREVHGGYYADERERAEHLRQIMDDDAMLEALPLRPRWLRDAPVNENRVLGRDLAGDLENARALHGPPRLQGQLRARLEAARAARREQERADEELRMQNAARQGAGPWGFGGDGDAFW